MGPVPTTGLRRGADERAESSTLADRSSIHPLVGCLSGAKDSGSSTGDPGCKAATGQRIVEARTARAVPPLASVVEAAHLGGSLGARARGARPWAGRSALVAKVGSNVGSSYRSESLPESAHGDRW
jgi:hypothetical protein